jgi:hypothetical protein
VYSLAIAFNKETGVESSLREERTAFEFLGEDTLRQRNYALRISKLVGFMVKEHSSWDKTIKLMSLMSQLPETWECHRRDGGKSTRRHVQMVVFWAALQSTLRLTFTEDAMRWTKPSGDLTKLAIAWTRLIKTVRESTEQCESEEDHEVDPFKLKKSSVFHGMGAHLDAEAAKVEKQMSDAVDAPARSRTSTRPPTSSGRADPQNAQEKRPAQHDKKDHDKKDHDKKDHDKKDHDTKDNEKKDKKKKPKPISKITLEALSKKYGVTVQEMDNAIKPVQRCARQYLARKKMTRLRQRALNDDEIILRDSWDKIQPNLPAFASLLFHRMLEVDVDLQWNFDFEDDLAQHGTVLDMPSATSDPKDPSYIQPCVHSALPPTPRSD